MGRYSPTGRRLQLPFMHAKPPWLQGTPHAPQLSISILRFAHVPLQQVAPASQTVPQEPQLFGSLVTSTQTPPPQSESCSVLEQSPHVPGRRALPVGLQKGKLSGQMEPQVPQLSGSALRSTHALPHWT